PTVKLAALVAVPLGFCTWMGPLVEAAGTVAVICEFELTLNVAPEPLKSTAVVPRKFAPAITTLVPAGPVPGEKPAICSGKFAAWSQFNTTVPEAGATDMPNSPASARKPSTAI